MSSGFTWKKKRKFTGDLPRPPGTSDGMLFGPASSGTPVRNKWYDRELMRNLAVQEQSKKNLASGIKNIVTAAVSGPDTWKRIKLVLGSGVPGAVMSAGVNLGLIEGRKRLKIDQDIQKNIQQSGFVPAANGVVFTSAQDATAEDLVVAQVAQDRIRKRARARTIIRKFFRKKAGPRLLKRRRVRFAIRDARQTLAMERRANRIAIARGLRRRFAPRRRRLARARNILRKFFRYGRKTRRYWGRNLQRVRGYHAPFSPDY